jgi:hypothetical protein
LESVDSESIDFDPDSDSPWTEKNFTVKKPKKKETGPA